MNNNSRRKNNAQPDNYRRQMSRSRARRIRICQIRRNIFISLLALLFIITGVLVGSSLLSSSRANASNEEVLYKYYTSIEVQQGDTLWSIADTYRNEEVVGRESYIDELVSLNNLQNETIHAGDYITVAYYSNEFK